MVLHRDIHWIGRQWAVTGHGMQLIDQKLQGFFDIEAARLWDEALVETMRAKDWINAADFDKGLAVARARYPQPPGATPPLPKPVPVPAIEPVAPADAAPAPGPPVPATPDPVQPSQSKPPDFHMRFAGRAAFVRPWRVWMKRQT